jgi:uroporphyrinogen-III synthase
LGEKTAKTLKDYGYKAHFTGGTTTGKEFLQAFVNKYGDKTNLKIFVPVSALADIRKFEILQGKGWEVLVKPVYNTVQNKKMPPGLKEQILSHEDLILTFFSPSAYKNFIDFIPANQFKPGWKIAAIGKTTKKIIEEHGQKVHILPEKSTAEDLIQAIKNYL